ncbi:MAG: glucosaminidase domain-containing protein [Hyphomicrobium sp.]|jgi:hypothetical protein
MALCSLVTPVWAAELPAVRSSETNTVPDCATPGRLMAYVRERNPKLAAKYDGLATEYMRSGEALKLRWDYGFFQMLLETGYLTYTGDVKPDQNNFAGLGATGGGVRGESFKDVATGARAHLEHLLMYSGATVENPVAERTRNVQEWGVLTSWQKHFTRPITFTDVAKQWAPTSRGYSSDIDTIADRFFTGACMGPDPRPELVAEARGTAGGAKTAEVLPKTKGQEAASRAVEAARTEGATRSGLGAPGDAPAAAPQTIVAALAAVNTAPPAKASPQFKIINAQPAASTISLPGAAAVAKAEIKAEDKPTAAAARAATEAKVGAKPSTKPEGTIEVAAALEGAAAANAKPEKKTGSGKCRVWTASYGGSKAIIIKAVSDKTVNYTVLDVNEGSERHESDAYISAYAKGGVSVGEFASQSQALEKAFDLCPEG